MVASEGQRAIRLTLDTVSDPSHQRTRQQPEEGMVSCTAGKQESDIPFTALKERTVWSRMAKYRISGPFPDSRIHGSRKF